MEISPSHLSRVLNGSKKLSFEKIHWIGKSLQWTPEKIEKFRSPPKKSYPPKKSTLIDPNVDLRNSQRLDAEKFKILSDWLYLPLLEILRSPRCQPNSAWLAKKFDVTEAQIEEALLRLENLKFIQRKGQQIHILDYNFLITSDDLQALAIQNHHQQMIDKAKKSLNQDRVEDREFRGLNLNFDRRDLLPAKKDLRKFFKIFNKKYSKKNGSDVFQLNLQFFSLTKKEN